MPWGKNTAEPPESTFSSPGLHWHPRLLPCSSTSFSLQPPYSQEPMLSISLLSFQVTQTDGLPLREALRWQAVQYQSAETKSQSCGLFLGRVSGRMNQQPTRGLPAQLRQPGYLLVPWEKALGQQMAPPFFTENCKDVALTNGPLEVWERQSEGSRDQVKYLN